MAQTKKVTRRDGVTLKVGMKVEYYMHDSDWEGWTLFKVTGFSEKDGQALVDLKVAVKKADWPSKFHKKTWNGLKWDYVDSVRLPGQDNRGYY